MGLDLSLLTNDCFNDILLQSQFYTKVSDGSERQVKVLRFTESVSGESQTVLRCG